MIDFLTNPVLGRQANDQLVMLTGVSFGVLDPPRADIYGGPAAAIQEKWKAWWKAHRGRVLIRSYYAFHTYPADLISSKKQ